MEQFTVQPFLVARQDENRKAWFLRETWGSMDTSTEAVAESYLRDINVSDDFRRLLVWRLHPSHMSCGSMFNPIHGDERPRSVYGDLFEVEMAMRLVR